MSEQESESVGGRTSRINRDEELSSDFSTTVYESDSIQHGLDNEAINSRINRDEELSSDFSTTVYESDSIQHGLDNEAINSRINRDEELSSDFSTTVYESDSIQHGLDNEAINSRINRDEELSSDFSTTVYESDSIQHGLDNEAINSSLNRDEELSSDFSTMVYESDCIQQGSDNETVNSRLNRDEELSSDFSTTVYESDCIQQGSDNEAVNSRLNRDEELSSDFSTTVYRSVSLHQGSNNVPIYDTLCDTCKRDGKQINAEGYCVDCSEYLCQGCYAFHKKLKAVQHHVLLDKQNMPSEKLKAKVKDICEEKCPSHADKVTEYFCQSCDKLGCTACITTNHNKCSRVDHIPDIVTRLEDSEEYKEVTGALQDISVQLEHNQARYDTNILKKSYLKEKAKCAVKQHREEMSKILDKFEEYIDKEIETMDAYNEGMLKSVSSMQKSLTFNLQTITTDLEKNQNAGQRCKLFMGIKKAKHTIIRLQDELLRLDVNNHIANYQFEESEKYEDLLKEMEESGKIELLQSSTIQEEIKRSNIKVKASVDKMNCTISALCLLPEDKLIVADVRNETLKVITLKAHLILSIRAMSSKPWDVTRVNDGQVITSLPDEGKIQFLSVDESGSMSKDNEIEVYGCCRGLAYSRGHLVVSFDKPESKVQILDTSGNVCKSFTRDSLGNQLFTKPWYLALSPDQYTIYISDNSRCNVTSLTLEGKVNSIYQDSDLRKPVGLTVDPAGSVYVVGSSMYSSKIHKLTDNCSKMQVFEDYSHGITSPRSITYCGKEHKLYVGMEFSDSMLVVSLESAIK